MHMVVTYLIVSAILRVNDVQSQETPKFIRNCEDPLIRSHLSVYNHTYCDHACGLISIKSRTRILIANNSLEIYDINNNRPSARCDTSGNCICNSPCIDTTRRRQSFNASSSSSICPPRLTDPLDTDTSPSSTTSSCSLQCSLMCPGGSGQICGEVKPLGLHKNIFARICTCTCSPSLQSCFLQTLVNSISPLKTFKLNVSFIAGILMSRRLIRLLFLLSAVGLSIPLTALLQFLSLAIILCDSVIQLFDK